MVHTSALIHQDLAGSSLLLLLLLLLLVSVTGLKRYFYSKRMEGLLSARGLRILDNSCDFALENPYKPLRLWCIVRRCVTVSNSQVLL
jgi:hypothetical protein